VKRILEYSEFIGESSQSAPQIIRDLIKFFKEEYGDEAATPERINNGLCDAFAADLVDTLGEGAEDFHSDMVCEEEEEGDYVGEMFPTQEMVEAEGYEWPKDITELDMRRVPFPVHMWVRYNGLNYDAEAPNGVRSFWDLPLFQRYLQKTRAAKR
jgi:hypothetical protein